MRRRSDMIVPLTASGAHPEGAAEPSDQRRLSVLAVTPIFDNGGTEVQLLELGRGLLARGDRYRVVTGKGVQLQALGSADIPYRLVGQTAGLVPIPVELAAYGAAILHELLAESVSVIQSTSIRTTYAAALASAAYSVCRPGRPKPAIVTTLHGGKQSNIYGQAARHLRRLSDAVVVVSHDGRSRLIETGYPPDQISVVPPGRDLAAYTRIRERLVEPAQIEGVSPSARVVLTVGRLTPLKGLDYLLNAWQVVASTVPDVTLVIVGNGEREAELKTQAAALGIEGRVVFAGFRTDVPALLARADLFVLSSLWEGLPMAAIEAMAAGCPVVATAVGGVPEVVESGVTGLLAPPQDAAALATMLIRLLSDHELSGALACAAAGHVQTRYTREAMVAATREVYLRVCERRLTLAPKQLACGV
jgi:glycosyltransferase involved in cell wall biosynthesis